MAAFFPILQQLPRETARQDTEQLQLWAAKRRRTESQMFLSQMNEEMEEAQVFAPCGVLLSSNERKERGQNEPRDGSWWASGYFQVEVLRKFCVKVVSISSSRPYALRSSIRCPYFRMANSSDGKVVSPFSRIYTRRP